MAEAREPMGLGTHFVAMACNNAWANHRLLKACRALPQAEFAAPRTGFFPSIKATLNHNLTVDWYYLEVMERSLAGLPASRESWRFFDPAEPFEDCGALAREQRATDQRLVAFCRALQAADFDKAVRIPRRAGDASDYLARILAHLFQHQVHHRGQAHAMLSGTSVKPPQLDEFFCANEAELRAGDFAELGFTEEGIWGERARGPG